MTTIPVLQTSLVKAFATCCPQCEHFLAVGVEELRAGAGKARCGKCSTVFDAVRPGFVEMGKTKRELLTICPGCVPAQGGESHAVRTITAEQLLQGLGNVGCPVCTMVFNACASLYEAPPPGETLTFEVVYGAMAANGPHALAHGISGSIGAGRNQPTLPPDAKLTINAAGTPAPNTATRPAPPAFHEPPRPQAGRFELAGRPMLERFLRENVIDVIENAARYQAFGVNFPGAIVLHGPPGCGKTFAVDKLIEYLGWPSYRMEASNIGSPYIHETSMKVAAIFDEAVKNAPSVIVIDEMDAFLPKRQTAVGSGQHAVEEVAEFLRRIPEAGKRRVLVVGMTNEIGLIDPAILRRGRFDHVIEVPMATETEIAALLKELFTGIPIEPGVKIGPIARQLCGRPLSDVSFVVKEAARLAALHRRSHVGDEMMSLALQATVGV